MKIPVPIISSNSGSDIYFQDLKRGLVQHRIMMELVHFKPYFEFTPSLATTSFMRRAGVDACKLVHSNADYGIAFRVPNKPFIVTVHHNVFDEEYQRSTSLVQKIYHYGLLRKRLVQALRSADRVVAVSHSTRASLERTFGATNIGVIYNGIDTDLFKPIQLSQPSEATKKIRLLFVGNLIRRKGADLLPEIMKKLGRDYVLFYTSSLRPGKRFNEPNMIPLGVKYRSELVEVYNSCDIFLFPSRLEGFGYVVAEAMACGKPIVCTNGSSLPELVVDRKGGYLCERGNVEDFAQKIRALANVPGERECMGEFNRQRVLDNFTLAPMATGYARLYQSVLQA